MKQRIYKYDNIKALLIFFVVLGHMTTDYVSDSHMVRWTTLWFYSFHMPAFILISGLLHKRYITKEKALQGVSGETQMRWDKMLGFFLCGYGLKLFLQFTRTLMGQHPLWHTIAEPGIPWYLFVMAEYELLFYLLRRIDNKVKPHVMIIGAFVLSALIGYVPWINDTFCLSRMINFLPIYMLGYYTDMRKFPEAISKKKYKIAGAVIVAAWAAFCYLGPWKIYGLRAVFTGRRTYEFLAGKFPPAMTWGGLIRLAVWAVAILLSLSIMALIPDRDMGYITTIGSRTLNIYFWHRPVGYLFRNWKVLPRLFMLFGGTYNEAVAGEIHGRAFEGPYSSMLAAYIVYILIAVGLTALFSLKIFEHPCSDIMKLSSFLTGKCKRKAESK